jgi:MFS family permease
MFIRRYFNLLKDPVWSKILTLTVALTFIMLADALISYWAPNLIQDALKDPVKMGLIISFQSVIGFGADLIFPNLLKNATVKKLVIFAILCSFLTLISLVSAIYKPIVLIFLLSMALWGIYYEFMTFANHQFVADAVPTPLRSGAWGVIGIFKNFAYFLGPLLGAWMLLNGNLPIAISIFVLLVVGFVIISISGKSHDSQLDINFTQINLWQEIKHWRTLFTHVWPLLLISLILGCIDAAFWTTGAVWTEHLAKQSYWGGLFLPLYAFPSLFMGFLVAKWKISKGKKRMAAKFMILAGAALYCLAFNSSIYWQLAMVLISGIMLAIVYPLVEAVYSDIVARMGKVKKHMIGLTGSVVNISYIFWPIISGYLAKKVGERMTFSIIGIATVVVATILFFTIPKKLKVPQKEIKTWEND